MPKTGLSPSEWEERLRCLANNTFTFRRGQRPPPESQIAKKVRAIESCPSQGSFTGRSVLGHAIPCKCGYHKKQDQVKKYTCICLLHRADLLYTYCTETVLN